jgi:hypothetical protein
MKTDDLDEKDLQTLAICLQMRMSGKIGKFVFYQMNGKTHVRRATGKQDPAKFTEKQLNNRKRFPALVGHARGLRETIIKPIWDRAARQKKISGYGLFLKDNNPAFDAIGQVPDPTLLHFSTGSNYLPQMLTAAVKPENPGSVTVEWDFNESWISERYEDDCLMCVHYPREAIKMINTGFTRKDKKASIELPLTEEKELYLFLFFWNKYKNIYSPDKAFKIR